MDMSAGGEKSIDSNVEPTGGISVRSIEFKEFSTLESQIRDLKNNVLDTNKSQKNEGSSQQRIEVMRHVQQTMQGSGDHVGLVAEENGKVVGFIFLKKENGIARVEEMWVKAAPGSQQPAIMKLIDASLSYYSKLLIPTIAPSHDCLMVCTRKNSNQVVMEVANDKTLLPESPTAA